MWPMVDLDDILHGGHEGCVGIRRDHPLVVQVRLENVFLSVRPMVLSLARATMFNSTTLFSSICSVHRAKPSGGVEQARAINFASLAPSKIRRLAEFGERLGVSTPSTPSSTSCWRTRATVTGLVCNPTAIWLSVNASPDAEASALSRMRPLPLAIDLETTVQLWGPRKALPNASASRPT